MERIITPRDHWEGYINHRYFANPELSELLEQRDLRSQFEFYYRGSKLYHIDSGKVEEDKDQLAYHFSDILLPDNAMILFGRWPSDWENRIHAFLNRVFIFERSNAMTDEDYTEWQTWLEKELTNQH